MARARNTNRSGASFSSSEVEAVWQKAIKISGEDDKKKRRDACGKKTIERDQHGKQTATGWEIDHIKPVASNGGDELANLQPLYWETNRDKADTYPWSCPG